MVGQFSFVRPVSLSVSFNTVMCLGIDVLVLNLLWLAEVWGDENGFNIVLVKFL